MDCENCEVGDLEQTYFSIGGGWISVEVTCNNCGTIYSGDLLIELMDKEEKECKSL